MQYKEIIEENIGVRIELSAFTPQQEKTAEWHAMLHVEPRNDGFQQQYNRLCRAEAKLLASRSMEGAQIVFKRYFLSDSTNQQPLMEQENTCSVSYIQQPPLDGSKIALWIYLQRGTEITHKADRLNSTIVRNNNYEHIWTMGMATAQGDSYQQTQTLLEDYENLLAEHQTTLEDNCIRTWFFVRDVDTQYQGLVAARRENFNRHGLTAQTHYIASTGIGGNPYNTKALIQMGCYTIKGFTPQQQQYLYAHTHLNRTSDYGVTFERGTLLKFGDRNHAYISGTASINNKGEVMHIGDIEKQTQRMWENVETLLQEANMTMDNAAQIIVYLRDNADYNTVSQMFRQKYPHVPTVFTLAPVCRPTWLIEMECIAIRTATNNTFNNF